METVPSPNSRARRLLLFLLGPVGLLLGESLAWGVVLDGNDDDEEGGGFLELLLDVAKRVLQARGTVGEEGLQPVARHDDDADVSCPLVRRGRDGTPSR